MVAYEPVFRSPPRDRREWWTCLRRFAAGWTGRPAGTVGHRTDEADRLEQAHGRTLSPAIAEWSAFHADGLGFPRDRHELGWHDELHAVTLLLQAEHDRYWGILPEHLDLDDPPVHTWRLDERAGVWDPPTLRSSTTTGFALNHLISYLPGTAGHLMTWVSTEEAEHITADLTGTMATRFRFEGAVLSEDTDAIVRLSTGRHRHPERPRPIGIDVRLGDGWSFPMPPSIDALVHRRGGFGRVLRGAPEPD